MSATKPTCIGRGEAYPRDDEPARGEPDRPAGRTPVSGLKKPGLFFRLFNAIVDAGHLRLLAESELWVLLCFMRRLNWERGDSFPSPREISGWTGLSIRQVKRIIGKLEEKGYLFTPPEMKKGGISADGKGNVARRQILMPSPKGDTLDVTVKGDIQEGVRVTSEAAKGDILPVQRVTPKMSLEQKEQKEQKQQHAVAVDDELIKHGVTPEKARQLAREHSPEKIRRHIDAILLRKDTKKDIKSVPAAIVSSITDNWETTATDQKQRAAEEKIMVERGYLQQKMRRTADMISADADKQIMDRLANADATTVKRMVEWANGQLKVECSRLPPFPIPANLTDTSEARDLVVLYLRRCELEKSKKAA